MTARLLGEAIGTFFLLATVVGSGIMGETVAGGNVAVTQNDDGGAFSEIALNFSRQSNLLFKLLTSIRSRQIGSHLAQLLLRIDYNRYFSRHGHDIGKIAA